MKLSLIQTEIVACALCKADGKDPDAAVSDADPVAPRKAWQGYEDEARRFIVAMTAIETWSQTLSMFRALVPGDEEMGTLRQVG